MKVVFHARVGDPATAVQKDPPLAAGAALVQFVPSDVITFQLVPAAIAGTRTHSTAIIPALTRERVVSEACQSSMVVGCAGIDELFVALSPVFVPLVFPTTVA